MAGRTGKGAWLALKNEASCQGACWHKCRGGSSVGVVLAFWDMLLKEVKIL